MTTAAVIAVVLAVVGALVLGAIAWWMLRRTLTMLKRLLIVAVVGSLVVAAIAAGAVFVIAQ